jgi:hypothetical protein
MVSRYGSAQAFGNGYDVATDVATFSDPDGSPPAIGSTSSSTTFERTVGPDSTQWDNYSNGGSYTSSAGLNLQVSLSGGWDGLSVGSNVGLVDSSSATTDTSHAVDCALVDTNSVYAYQFIVSLDGSQWNSADVINAHIWLQDECTPNTPGCP